MKQNREIEISKEAASVFSYALEASGQEVSAARMALEDGAFLTSAGYTDADQERIEEAHFALKEIELGRAKNITTPETR